MISIQITKAEAVMMMELIHNFCTKSIENIDIALSNAVDKENISKAARSNYISNLEKEVKRLTELTNFKAEAPSEDAPYGLKKDGTPKARPGRKTAKKAKKGSK